MTDFIKRRRKKKAQDLRKGKGTQKNSDKSVSTHKMEWGEDKDASKKRGKKVYTVNPSIAPTGKGGKYEPQTYKQAIERGEVFEFKKAKRAERFAAGSWKKGKDKREAMKAYRKKKKEERKLNKNK
tara:strand:+ start:1480 stop:1857 length:378 start_codon:yes stop_codon:yes gene_type:complete